MTNRAQDSSSRLGPPGAAWGALGLSAAAAGACWAASGASLGLLFGGIVFAALLVPPLGLIEERMPGRLFIAAAVNDGIGLVWLIAWMAGSITFVQWMLCYVVLIAWCSALRGLTQLIGSVKVHHSSFIIHHSPRVPAAAIVVTLALLWITWPIWLSPHFSSLGRPTVGWLVSTHPLLAINGAVPNLGIWTERPIAYWHLTSLGQDIAYELPRSVLPCAILHLSIGVAALAGSRWGRS